MDAKQLFEDFSFNVFINDIFYFIKTCDLYNYDDDNTLSFHCPDFDEILRVLQSEGKILIDWFCSNCMQANPNKFQAIAVGKITHEKSLTFNFGSVKLHVMRLSDYWVSILILD